ncbi:MAG TPA: isoprenylcysteine carboxyl methyltransferase family protein [Prevotella sp.]
MTVILVVFLVFFVLRLATLYISIRNEKRILAKGGIQYGKTVSAGLTLAHIAYYALCLYEAWKSVVLLDGCFYAGVVLMAFAYAVLFYVIYKLRDVWTVKLYILPQHRIETSWLFRGVRHPNYFLNIVPELIGVGLLCHAWHVMVLGGPVYAVLLALRIVQEEKAMKGMLPALRKK